MQARVAEFDLVAEDKLGSLGRAESLSSQHKKQPMSWCAWSVNGLKLIASGAAGAYLVCSGIFPLWT
jgi:hypothetical protein